MPVARTTRPTDTQPAAGNPAPGADDDEGVGNMTEVHEGLEGVVAFRTEIAEPDKEGSALRSRFGAATPVAADCAAMMR